MNTTTHKGDIAELMVATELIKRGYVVARPLTNGAPYDLLVDTGSKVAKVQVKSAVDNGNGSIRVKLRSSKYHRGRTSVSYFGLVDCIIGVHCESATFILVQGDDLKSFEVNVRVSPARNNQQSRLRSADGHSIDGLFPSRLVGGAGFEPATPSV